MTLGTRKGAGLSSSDAWLKARYSMTDVAFVLVVHYTMAWPKPSFALATARLLQIHCAMPVGLRCPFRVDVSLPTCGCCGCSCYCNRLTLMAEVFGSCLSMAKSNAIYVRGIMIFIFHYSRSISLL